MTDFIQLHLLTSYPPSNLNRDDTGRPKTATMGGTNRLRISSQSLKRAWRTSDLFEEALADNIGKRSRRLGRKAFEALAAQSVASDDAEKWARAITEVFGTLENKKAKKVAKKATEEDARDAHLENCMLAQLVHISPQEQSAVDELVNVLAAEQREPTKDELKLLRHKPAAVDIAMFGRMLAAEPSFNVEAAVQVAHAISVEPIIVEDDFFTAVDDLNAGDEDMGAGHMGETGFAAALFYLYICIDRTELIENLQGDIALADKAITALLRCAAQVSPTGKQNSFASRAHASYILAERGNEQPRTLSVAFLKAIAKEDDVLTTAIQRLTEKRTNFAKAYGEPAQAPVAMNADSGEGSLSAIADYITG